MNSGRILKLDNNEFRFHDAGSYADLFVNADRSRCWKLFRKLPENTRSFDVFESELAAYEIATKSTALRKLVAQLYRSRIASIEVIDINGQSVTSEYFRGLNYELEFINKPFQKFGTLSWDDTRNLREIFFKEGITHLSDASIVGDVNSPKIIDFAVQEYEIWHE